MQQRSCMSITYARLRVLRPIRTYTSWGVSCGGEVVLIVTDNVTGYICRLFRLVNVSLDFGAGTYAQYVMHVLVSYWRGCGASTQGCRLFRLCGRCQL
jgi:hypothetical protein